MVERTTIAPFRGLGLAAALLAFALVAGCARRGEELARVGDHSITVADFDDVAGRVHMNYPGPPDSAKRRLLEDLIQRSLMLEVSRRPGFLIDSLVTASHRATEEEILSTSLIQDAAPRLVPVSEAEVRALYDQRKLETHVQVIYTVEHPMAVAARADLDRGEPFAGVANRYNLPGVVPAGGDVGWVAPGSLVDPLDGIIRTARVGSTTGPFQAPGEGWFVVRVLERRSRVQPPLVSERFNLYEMLRQRKQRILLMRMFDQLRADYRLEVEPEGVQLMFMRYNHPEMSQQNAPPTAQELATVLARWDGGAGYRGVYTFAEALHDLDTAPGEKPTPSMLPSFQLWIETQVLRRLAVIESRRRHLDQDPTVARRIEEREKNQLVEAVYAEQVTQRAVLSDLDLQAAYDRHATEVGKLESAHFQTLLLPDSAGAAQLLTHVRAAPSLRDAILLASPGLAVRDQTVRFPTGELVGAQLQAFAAAESPGAYGGPIRAPGGWMVFQLVSKQQTTPPLSSLDASTREALQNEAMEVARERRLAALTDSLRQAVPVVVHAERLKRIPWPPTSPVPTAG